MRDGHRLLREATHAAHERLDGLFASFDLGSDAGYRRFIGAQASAMLPVEAALGDGGAEQVVDDWPSRRRSDALLADAAALGVTPRPVAAPVFDSLPSVAGALYVVEGSRHGARHLVRQVAAGFPLRFLDIDQVPGNWGKLLDRVDMILYSPDTRDKAVTAALATFDCFERAGRNWMND